MSAVLRPEYRFEPMREVDLARILEIEQSIYAFPWTLGNFRDSIRAGHGCWVYREDRNLIGYAVLAMGAEEAHLLNLSVAERSQNMGHGRRMLGYLIGYVRARGARVLFLEVRPSNAAGKHLYASHGFVQVGVRRAYYPALKGREDALVLSLAL